MKLIPARETLIAGEMKVRRILPFREKRMVGPFIFIDEMGPIELEPGPKGDVGSHPHIGLSTVTYLFSGELFHRDSIGSKQRILPGDVNWMTAGRGIAHSERIPDILRNQRQRLHGIQIWVALPIEAETVEPSFVHYPKDVLPQFQENGTEISLVAGEAFGFQSPIKTHSELFYLVLRIPAGKSFSFPKKASHEAAFYGVEGKFSVAGQSIDSKNLSVFSIDEEVRITALSDVLGILIGGKPFAEPRHIWWNFVSSSKERIEEAKQNWREQKLKVVDEASYIPLPEAK